MTKTKDEAPAAVNVTSALTDWVKRAWRAGAPLLAVSTADQPAAIQDVRDALGARPGVLWDILDGWTALNDKGAEACTAALDGAKPRDAAQPEECLLFARALPEGSVLVMLQGSEYMDRPGVQTGILKLRDLFKGNKRCLALLGPGFDLPPALRGDFLPFAVPLPSRERLGQIVDDVHKGAPEKWALKPLKKADHERAVDAVTGLSPFGAEQALAVSMSEKGLDQPEVWRTKASSLPEGIEFRMFAPDAAATYAPPPAMAAFYDAVFEGPRRPKAVVVVSELEKAMAGSDGGDLSGTKSDMLGEILRWTDSVGNEAKLANLLLGPPGVGKDGFARYLASKHRVPYVGWNVSAAQGSLVGSSGKNLRAQIAALDALSDGDPLLLASVNDVRVLKAELVRRFSTCGSPWFVDTPPPEQRRAVWEIQAKLRGLKWPQELPVDRHWTPSDIRDCCTRAWLTGKPIAEAARGVIPLYTSQRETFQNTRNQAVKRYLDAMKGSVYLGPAEKDEDPINVAPAGRKLGG